MIMVDTNVFYNFLFETELTEKATKIFELEEPLFTSFTVNKRNTLRNFKKNC